MNELIKKTLDSRGLTEAVLSEINNGEHEDLKRIDDMCEALHEIYERKEQITILSDFDTDGVMCGVEGFAGLAELGFFVNLFIPNPKEGYGFDESTIDRLISAYPNTKAIITADTGISCMEGISRAKDLGLTVLLTDHHIQSEQTRADVTVNPACLDETYLHPAICGAFVLYQILVRYAERYNTSRLENIKRLSLFAGIGTVSDIMPVLYENRQLLKDSLNICKLLYDGMGSYITGHPIYVSAFRGLTAFLTVLSAEGVIKSCDDITEDLYGFYISPMINSVKRMEDDLCRVYDIFFGNNPERDVKYLVSLNKKRKDVTAFYMKEVTSSIQPFAPYIYLTDAPTGIVGLLAGSLMGNAPILVVNRARLSGSGRSPEWYKAVDRLSPKGVKLAGHNGAFGVSFGSMEEVAAAYNAIRLDLEEIPEKEKEVLRLIDFTADENTDIFTVCEYLSEMKNYRPFGRGFNKPYVRFSVNPQKSVWEKFGKNGEHLRISVSCPTGIIEIVCFGQGDKYKLKGGPVSVMGEFYINEFNGGKTLGFRGSIQM